ncbi:unnamed protein product [Rhodiola kirilowii]
MGRTPCCANVVVNRGAWCVEEDRLLTTYINAKGEGNWKALPQKAGLNRCGKSCRLRWINYLKPGIKRGGFTLDEDDLLIKLHNLLGNRWALIAGRLPGRTDNEIKNYWKTTLSKKKPAIDNTKLNQNIRSKQQPRSLDHNQRRPDCRPTADDQNEDDQQVIVHYTKVYRCNNENLPASLQMLDNNNYNNVNSVMKNEEILLDSLLIWEDAGGSSSMFSSSPEESGLLLSRDHNEAIAMPDWCTALEKMASFLDLEVDDWK